MKILFSARLWTVLAVVLSTVMALMIVATNLANSYSTLIATELDLETWRVDYGDGEKIDFFTADYTTHDSIKEFAHKTSYDLEADGLVLLKNEEIERDARGQPVRQGLGEPQPFGAGRAQPRRQDQHRSQGFQVRSGSGERERQSHALGLLRPERERDDL